MKEGWKYMKLGEVCYFQNGFAFKSNQFEDNGIGVVRISDIKNGEVSKEKMTYINPNSFKEDLSSFLVKPNDILIAMSGGTTGKLGINKTNETFFQNQRVGLFREDKEKLNHNFLYYYLHTKSEESLKIAAGAAQPNLSTAQIKQFPIPVPPLSEQQRIVSFLDASFAKIENIKSNAQKNLDNAEQLWKAQLEKQFDNQKWEKKKLGECGTFKNGMNFNSTDIGYSIHSLGVGDFKNNFQIDDTSILQTISLKTTPTEDYLLKDGDIVFVRSNGNKELVGRCIIVYPNQLPTTFSGFCIRFRNCEKAINTVFLTHFLKSDTLRKKLRGKEGANISNLNQKLLSEIEIPIPPLAEQERIVKELDALSAKINTLKANYRRQIECCDELRQSLLKKAFEGEL